MIRYTRAQWGVAQTRINVAALERGIARLVVGGGPFKDMSALYPQLRMMHCEQHYIFVLPRNTAPGLVIAILHERMDLMVRLAERLD